MKKNSHFLFATAFFVSACLNSSAYAQSASHSGIGGFFHRVGAWFQGSNGAHSDVLAIPQATATPTQTDSLVKIQAATTPILFSLTPPLPPPPPPPAPSFDACSEMQAGESRVITQSALPASLNIDPAPGYLLLRDDDSASGQQIYEAVLNINFIPKPGEDPSIADDIRTKTETCYENLPPLDSTDHKTLKIRFAKPGEPAPIRDVNVTGEKVFREDMTDWSTQTSCPIIIHETLHLLGLVDSYKETLITTPSGAIAYDCRAQGPDDSIMNNYVDAHLSQDTYFLNSCSCETTACTSEIADLKAPPSVCPGGIAPKAEAIDKVSTYDLKTDPVYKKSFDQSYGQYMNGKVDDTWVYLFISIQKNPQPLLFPAEFRLIISPGCMEKNQVYYQCAINAYRSTTDGGCANEPSVCNDPNAWLQ